MPENELETLAQGALEEAEKPVEAEHTDTNETPEIHTVELPSNDPNSDRTKTPKVKRRKTRKVEKEIEHEEEPSGRKQYKHRKRTSPIPRKRKGSWLSDFFDF